MKPTTVLVTGASSGIGKEIAMQFLNENSRKPNTYKIYVTARKTDSLTELVRRGCHALQLDVTSEESMQETISQVIEKSGSVDILINNAGFCQNGVVEELSIDEIRRQFETNVFGLIRMCQLVLPSMRHQKRGRIINIGSAGGDFTSPGASAYHASKYALESFSDGLRMELAPFGIDVVLIKPGGVKTAFVEHSGFPHAIQGNPYQEFRAKFLKMVSTILDNNSYGILTPQEVANVVLTSATVRAPKTRYRVGMLAKILPILRHTLSDKSFDKMLLAQLK